jgi:hypothetical protein
MLLDQCPHCGTQHVQTTPRFTEAFHPSTNATWQVLRCQNPGCQRLVLLADEGGTKRMYPGGSHELRSDISLSQAVRDEYREAGRCLDAGCFKASLVMSRRVLQRCLKEQGCSAPKLVDAIDEAVKNGLLRKAFHPVADEIRQYGNLGAHPDDEQLGNASQLSASLVLRFAALLIHEFYEVPADAQSLKAARQQPKAP